MFYKKESEQWCQHNKTGPADKQPGPSSQCLVQHKHLQGNIFGHK